MWPDRIAVVGAGTMGVGIAQVFAAHGIETVVADLTPEQAADARERAVAGMARLAELGCVDPAAAGAVHASLEAAESLERAVAAADLVVEAVTEQAAVKQEVYAAVEAAAGDEAVIATNTSSIPIASLASSLRRPARFLGVHWFVPPLLVPCVEVIAAPATGEPTVDRVIELLARVGKSAVRVGDGPGFVANRVQFAMFREAAAIVEEGLATPQQVDEVVRSSFGFRLPFFGPFAIADMAGLDVYADIYATLERGLGEEFRVPPIVAEAVEHGRLGVKAGRGFFEVGPDAARLFERRDRAYGALGRLQADLDA